MKRKVSSSGGLRSKIAIILLFLLLLRMFYHQFDFSFMAFLSFIVLVLVFFYLFIILFYDPRVAYDENRIYFKKFNKIEDSISFKQIVRLSQNVQSFINYGGTHSKYHYRLDYISNEGKSKSINFYSKVSQEDDIKELIGSIRKANRFFIIDWTVPKKVW